MRRAFLLLPFLFLLFQPTVHSSEMCGSNDITVNEYAKKAEVLGYVVEINLYSRGAIINLVKTTEFRRGFLWAKWLRREQIKLEYFMANNCLYFWEATSTVTEKAPMGDWHEKKRNGFAPFLQAELFSDKLILEK